MVKIHNLGNFIVNCFVIEQDKGLIIIDSGYPGGFSSFIKKFNKKGFKKEDIKFLFLTHCHDDHVGFYKELTEFTDAPVILHPIAAKRLKLGHNPHTHGASYKLMQKICIMQKDKEKRFPPIELPDRYLLFNGEQFILDSGMQGKIVNLPGHTADSIGIMLPDGRLIAGDTAMNILLAVYHPLVLEDLRRFITVGII